MDLSKISMYQACLLHSRAERVLKSLVSNNLEEWGITRMEWLLLATIVEDAKTEAGHTMGDIALLLDVRLSQVTALVSSMTNAKLVTQTVAKHDKRTRYVTILPRGKKFLEDIELSMRSAMRTWLAGVPRDQLSVYMQTVAQLGSESR